MTRSTHILWAIVFFLLPGRSQAAQPVRFHDDIKPLLAIHCSKCHGPETAKSGLRLDRRDSAFAKGESDVPAIVPGNSGKSELVRRITSNDPEEIMPKKGQPLKPAEIERLRAWIDQGAPWPDQDDYWAFQTPMAVPIPARGSSNPIDRFIDARLADQSITPAPLAAARTLLRRAFAGLLGVPPSPQEADAFLNDSAPDAYEKLIDRLLADSRYGERWARHWLDLVRYSESDGLEDDKIRPHAWRYRDYVIRSLNADKPYDRFVREQIAGDELWANDPDAWVATGFSRLGMWDGMSKEPAQRRQDFLNDATDAVGSVFLGVTVGCARCHDHKYDPITQQDYYALQAFFAGVKRENHDLGECHDPPHVVEAHKKAQAELASLRGQRDSILRKAREDILWARRCEVDENAQVKVTDQEVKKRAEFVHPGRLADLDKQIKEPEYVERLNRPAAEAVFETSGSAPKTMLLKGGELSRPGPEVQPAFIQAMAADGGATSKVAGGRRTALANWLTSPDNPLTARVIVNRLWQHHFGRGIVATPSDFGRHGQPPTHRELLDWLAGRFIEDGWSLKRMHRLMMTSAAYKRSSSAQSAAASVDPENKLLWRANRRRLEAEAIRDSILTVSGRLSPTAGGPGVYPRISKDVNVQLPNNDKELSWGTCTEEENGRRTIYVFQRRSLTMPLVDVFDGAPMSQSCAARPETTVAPQALTLLNGEFCREEAKYLADRVRREAGEDLRLQIDRAFKLAFARAPSTAEMAAAHAFVIEQAKVRAGDPSAALHDFCHVLLNANEFIYLD